LILFLLIDFPYSHGLTATIVWSLFIFALIMLFWPNITANKSKVALTLIIAFTSHFLLDLLVHVPEIPVWNSNSIKLGLSLWNTYPIQWIISGAIVSSLAFWLDYEK
jgi:hypothetical protein